MLNTDWDLSPIYKGFEDEQYTKDFEDIIRECALLREYVKQGYIDALRYKELILRLNDLLSKFGRVARFSSLILAIDVTDAAALTEQNKVDKFGVELEQLISAITKLTATIPELDEVISSDKTLNEFSFIIKEMKSLAGHMLPDEIESAVLLMQLTGGKAWENLRNTLDGTAMVEYNGELLPLPKIRGMAYDPDAEVRKNAYIAELKAYEKYSDSMAAALNSIKGEAIVMAKMKGYDSVLDQILDISRMDKETLEAMLKAIKKYLPKFREYLKAKAKLLGHKNGLPFYDLFAPVGEESMRFNYDEAHSYLIDILGRFSNEMGEFVDFAFKNRWIDALPKPGKGGGAFCSTIEAIGESRIMSNFNNSFSDVCTLSHELGHAYHGKCLKNEYVLNRNYPMPLAETASIFNEMLVTQAALNEADDKKAFSILESELMEATQVIVDIYSRYLFETELFSKRTESFLSVEELNEMIIDAQKKAYGDGLDPEFLHPYMWQNKVHYYFTDLHFYNFPYAFGLLFARGVFERYEKGREGFIELYNNLLKSTGTNTIADTAKLIDIDVRTVEFWEESLEGIARNIDRFIEIVG